MQSETSDSSQRANGLYVIAALNVLAAILLAVSIDNPSRYPLVIPIILFLAIAWGMFKRRAWARVLALVVHWIVFVGTIVFLAYCLISLPFVPQEGIGFALIFIFCFAVIALPVLGVSGWTVWYLHKRPL